MTAMSDAIPGIRDLLLDPLVKDVGLTVVEMLFAVSFIFFG